MGGEYLVFSVKLSSWWGGASSPYTSSWAQAKRFPTKEAALKFCKTHVGPDGSLAAIPVAVGDIMEVVTK